MPTVEPVSSNSSKKLLDLAGLQRYDDKLKDYIENEVSKCGLDVIPTSDVEELFEEEE